MPGQSLTSPGVTPASPNSVLFSTLEFDRVGADELSMKSDDMRVAKTGETVIM